MNPVQENEPIQAEDLMISAKALLNIEKENLLDFIAYLSPFAEKGNVFGYGYIDYEVTEDELTEIRFQIAFSEESIMFFNYLNYWCDVYEFSADIYSQEDHEEDERIFLETDTYYRTTARCESLYADMVEAISYEDFRIFRTLCLRDSVKENSSSYKCSEKGLTRNAFLTALTNSHNIEMFQKQLSAIHGRIDFSDFIVEIDVETELKDTDEEMELSLFTKDETLYISYRSEIKFFENKRVFPIVVPTLKDRQEVLMNNLPKGSRTEVKWDFLEDGEPLETILEANFAKRYYDSGTIQIQHAKEWVSPCSICINRLLHEIEGCRTCTFEFIIK